MNRLLKNSLLVLIFTVILGFIIVFISSNSPEARGWSLIIVPMFGIYNLAFLLAIYFMRLSRFILLDFKYLILEIVLYFTLYLGIVELIKLIPFDLKFDVTPTSTSIKFYLAYPFDFIYTFLIIMTFLVIFRKWVKKQVPTTKNIRNAG